MNDIKKRNKIHGVEMVSRKKEESDKKNRRTVLWEGGQGLWAR